MPTTNTGVNAGNNRTGTNQAGINATWPTTSDPTGLLVAPPVYGMYDPYADISDGTDMGYAGQDAPYGATGIPPSPDEVASMYGIPVGKGGDATRARIAQLHQERNAIGDWKPQASVPFDAQYPDRPAPLATPEYDQANEVKRNRLGMLITSLGGLLGGQAAQPYIGAAQNDVLDYNHRLTNEQYNRNLGTVQQNQSAQDANYNDSVNEYKAAHVANTALNSDIDKDNANNEKPWFTKYRDNAQETKALELVAPKQDQEYIKGLQVNANNIVKQIVTGRNSPEAQQQLYNQLAQVNGEINKRQGSNIPVEPTDANDYYGLSQQDQARFAQQSAGIKMRVESQEFIAKQKLLGAQGINTAKIEAAFKLQGMKAEAQKANTLMVTSNRARMNEARISGAKVMNAATNTNRIDVENLRIAGLAKQGAINAGDKKYAADIKAVSDANGAQLRAYGQIATFNNSKLNALNDISKVQSGQGQYAGLTGEQKTYAISQLMETVTTANNKLTGLNDVAYQAGERSKAAQKRINDNLSQKTGSSLSDMIQSTQPPAPHGATFHLPVSPAKKGVPIAKPHNVVRPTHKTPVRGKPVNGVKTNIRGDNTISNGVNGVLNTSGGVDGGKD